MPKVALEASTDNLADFIDAQPMSAATGYTHIANLRAFYGWAKSQGHIAAYPSGGLGYGQRQRRAAADVVASEPS
jgi:hypothetical protein